MPASLLPILLEAALKGAVLFAIVVMAMPFLRRRSAAVRHAAWTFAIGAQLVLPLAVVLSPSWGAPLVRQPEWVADAFTASSSVAGGAASGETSASPPAADAVEAAPSAGQRTERPATLATTLTAFWSLGAALILLHLVVGTIGVWRLAVRGRRVLDAAWLAAAHQVAARIGISRPLTLLRDESVGVPITWGVVYPVVLLPADAESWDDEQRSYVLVHEMAHVRRFDALTQLIGQVTLALFWFDPLVWLAVAHMRAEREHACDDYVLRTGTPPSRYAGDLLSMVRSMDRPDHRSATPAFAALAMARRSEFEGRMMAILEDATARNPLSRRGRVAGAVAMAVVVLVLAGFDPLAAHEQAAVPAVSIHRPAPVPVRPTTAVRAPASRPPQARSGQIDWALATMSPRAPKAAILAQYARSGDDTLLVAALRAVPSLSSDGEKSVVLTHAAPGALGRGDVRLRQAFFAALASIASDGDASVPLVHALANGQGSPAVTGDVLRATARMRSPQAALVVLINAAQRHLIVSDSLRTLYVQVAGGLTSEKVRQDALTALLHSGPSSP